MTEAERPAPCPLCGESKGHVTHSRKVICGACFRTVTYIPRAFEPTTLAADEAWSTASAHAESLRATIRSQAAEIEALRSLYRRAINEANGLTNYVEDRPELRSAEKRIAKIEQEFLAAIDAARQS